MDTALACCAASPGLVPVFVMVASSNDLNISPLVRKEPDTIKSVLRRFQNEEDKIQNRIQNLFICFDDNSIVIYNPIEN